MTGELSSQAAPNEIGFEGALRPGSLNEFVGQAKARGQLRLLLDAALMQQRTPDHILLAGPPGLGKTTLSMIVATELGKPLHQTSGPAIQHAGDLAAVLSALTPGEVLFIDEIHRMARSAEEMLYLAMEDFRVDVVVGKGPGATAIPLDIERFTLVGATTRAGLLPSPLRDRFGFTAHLDFYDASDLEIILRRSAVVALAWHAASSSNRGQSIDRSHVRWMPGWMRYPDHPRNTITKITKNKPRDCGVCFFSESLPYLNSMIA